MDRFDPDRAAAYLGVGEPPRTALLRGGLEALHAYNQALAGLAGGASGPRLAEELSAAAANLSATWRLIGTGAAPGFDVLATGLRRVLPILAELRAIEDRREFRAKLIAAHPAMRKMLLDLRSATPVIFQALHEAQVDLGNLDFQGGLSPAASARIENDRRLLAGWVVLIDQTVTAMDAAVEATHSEKAVDIAALVQASIRLRVLAEAIRVRGVY